MPIQKFASKLEIYRANFDIAIKFVLVDRIIFSDDHYSEVYKRFRQVDNYKMEDCGDAIDNIAPAIGVSVGHFLEIPIKTPNGLKTAEFVFLEHETGAEIFIALGKIAQGVATTLGAKYVAKQIEESVDTLKNKYVRAKMSHVEIRTETKSEKLLLWEDIDILPDGIGCLAKCFSAIPNLDDPRVNGNTGCFKAKLREIKN